MDQARFKGQLVRDKEWLHELYQSQSVPNSKRLIASASDKKLDTLIRFLYFLSNGIIKMHKKNFDALERRHISYLKKNFESKTAVQKLIQSEREEKLKKLLKLKSVMQYLLYTLFNDNN